MPSARSTRSPCGTGTSVPSKNDGIHRLFQPKPRTRRWRGHQLLTLPHMGRSGATVANLTPADTRTSSTGPVATSSRSRPPQGRHYYDRFRSRGDTNHANSGMRSKGRPQRGPRPRRGRHEDRLSCSRQTARPSLIRATAGNSECQRRMLAARNSKQDLIPTARISAPDQSPVICVLHGHPADRIPRRNLPGIPVDHDAALERTSAHLHPAPFAGAHHRVQPVPRA